MLTGYLVLTSERRVLTVEFNNDHHAIERTIGTETVEHGTTFWTEDQLLVDGRPSDGTTTMHYRVQGVPFPFLGNGLLVGTDPAVGDIAERPTMELDEFTRMINFTRTAHRTICNR